MSPEKIPNTENERPQEGRLERPDDIEGRLLELGWDKEQIGMFAPTIRAMADMMVGGSKGDRAGKINIDLAIAKNGDGEEVAEVTLTGEGEALQPEAISALIDEGKLPVEFLTEASTEFFADQNKVVLRRKKHRASEMDSIQDR